MYTSWVHTLADTFFKNNKMWCAILTCTMSNVPCRSPSQAVLEAPGTITQDPAAAPIHMLQQPPHAIYPQLPAVSHELTQDVPQELAQQLTQSALEPQPHDLAQQLTAAGSEPQPLDLAQQLPESSSGPQDLAQQFVESGSGPQSLQEAEQRRKARRAHAQRLRRAAQSAEQRSAVAAADAARHAAAR